MTLKLDIAQHAFAAIDRRAAELIELSHAVLEDAESGYREHRTAAKVEGWMRAAGLSPRTGIAITGVVARVDSGRPGPNIAVMGELDSLIVPGHPNAHPETGAAHACGHHAQLGSMLGVLAAVLDEKVLAAISGSVTFMAVPAEEYIELDFRERLRADGKIEFFGGKQEFVRLGEFDDVDMAMLTHTTAEGRPGAIISGAHNGMVGKTAEFRGVAAHAGAAPHLGTNALNAANIAISAIHANRETFRDADFVRVHPIITHGGDAVSSVPGRVNIETYIRAANIDAIIEGAGKVDRALRAGAMAVGAEVEVRTTPGYMPSRYDPVFADVYRRSAEAVFGANNVRTSGQRASSSDAGDLSMLMPTIHPWADCATGNGHGVDYLVQDYDMAVVKAAKAMAGTVIELLSEDAAAGRRVAGSFRPEMTKDRYLAQLREMRSERVYTE
ncbi:MAG: amidohydrolase [Chloroflexi bacterium]|nr:amidohydrolase [Chloroflexota bacterium]